MRLDHLLPRLPTVEHGSYERVLVAALVPVVPWVVVRAVVAAVEHGRAR